MILLHYQSRLKDPDNFRHLPANFQSDNLEKRMIFLYRFLCNPVASNYRINYWPYLLRQMFNFKWLPAITNRLFSFFLQELYKLHFLLHNYIGILFLNLTVKIRKRVNNHPFVLSFSYAFRPHVNVHVFQREHYFTIVIQYLWDKTKTCIKIIIIDGKVLILIFCYSGLVGSAGN